MVMHDPEQRPAPSHPLKIRIHRDSTSRSAPSPASVQNGNGNANGGSSAAAGAGGMGVGAGVKEEPMSAVDERELEEALPRTLMGQVPLGVAVSRIVQHAYAELGNMAETLPSQADHDRKRHIFQYALTTRKGFVKMYVATKWADNARAVQTCLDIMQYCNRAGEQLQHASAHLATIAANLGSLRLRNADLLTALDVLGSGTYRRLPTMTTELYAPQKPMTREDVVRVMRETDAAIRMRLRTKEVIPLEMNTYRVADGRVYFTVPGKFAASFTVLGGTPEDPWWCSDVEFLFEAKGEKSTASQYPRIPPKHMRSLIQHETNSLLAQIQNQRVLQVSEENDLASINKSSDVVDAPLVRAFNFLQLLSLTYQLEILHAQANLMRNMGFADVLTVELARDRRSMKILYWVTKNRRAGQPPGKPEIQLPPHGGEITIAIEVTSEAVRREQTRERERERKAKAKAKAGPSQLVIQLGRDTQQLQRTGQVRSEGQTWAERVRADLERRSKLAAHAHENGRLGAGSGGAGETAGMGAVGSGKATASGLGGEVGGMRPSDEAEHARFVVRWEPVSDWLGISVPREAGDELELQVDPSALNFGTIYNAAIRKHSDALTRALHTQVPTAELRPFGPSGNLAMIQARILVSISPRNGFVLVQDTADMASPGRVGRFAQAGEAVSRQPQALAEQVALLKFAIVADSVEQQIRFWGYRCTRHRGFPPRYLVLHQKFGPGARHLLFTPLAGFPAHDVVIIVADEGFRYAIIETQMEAGYTTWKDGSLLDVKAIRRQKAVSTSMPAPLETEHSRSEFDIDGQTLRDIHAYCRARASYARIEAQLRHLGLSYHIAYGTSLQSPPPPNGYPLSQSIPALSVLASELFRQGALSGDDQDVENNVAVEVIGWWHAQAQCRVATSVRLKRAPPVSADLRKGRGRGEVLKITPTLYYNTTSHVVTFVSESVESCVAAFTVGWTSVRRLIVIAREIVKMHKTMRWKDVKLLSSDLQQVVFQYFQDYTLSIRWRPAPVQEGASTRVAIHEQNDAGSYELSFSRLGKADGEAALWNPHSDLEGHFTRRLQDDLAAGDITSFASLLRDSLPVLLEVERVATSANINGRIDIFYKAVGWYRVLIDSRYGLDFRLLSRRRLAILDATQVLERAQAPIPTTSNNSSVLTAIPHIEAITAQLVSERRPRPLISLTKGVLVSFEENGAGIEDVGVRFVELVIKALSAGGLV
ncbi:MED14-domain-containing protein [Ceratobasidium sp. AG-I]|nr:MED14-domain-containing protein [Ceratobasidium sp. AG-I]